MKLFGVTINEGGCEVAKDQEEDVMKKNSTGNLQLHSLASNDRDEEEQQHGHNSDNSIVAKRSQYRRTWTEEEHKRFLYGVRSLGRGDWNGIAKRFVITKTARQVSSHAQKYFIRQNNRDKWKNKSKFDRVTIEPEALIPQTDPANEVLESAQNIFEANQDVTNANAPTNYQLMFQNDSANLNPFANTNSVQALIIPQTPAKEVAADTYIILQVNHNVHPTNALTNQLVLRKHYWDSMLVQPEVSRVSQVMPSFQNQANLAASHYQLQPQPQKDTTMCSTNSADPSEQEFD